MPTKSPSPKPDARTDYRPELTVELVNRAIAVLGSRRNLTNRAGISRRRINYLKAGVRDGRPVVMSFAEQVILEAIVDEWTEDQPSGA